MPDNRDWTKTGTIQGMANWIQKEASVGGGGCLFVCVVRVDDLAIASDMALLPRDVLTVFEDRIPELIEKLEANRREFLEKMERQRSRDERRVAR